MEVFKEIAACCNIPIATGERLFSKYDFKRLLNVGKSVLDYVKNITDFKFPESFVELPKLQGIVDEVNKELVIEENKNPRNWKNPVWHHDDGTVAEW